MRTYHEFAEYDDAGIPPSELALEFQPTDAYKLPTTLDEKITPAWNKLTNANARLHDGDLLTLLEVTDSGYTIKLGRGSFREYFVLLRSTLPHSEVDLTLTDTERRFAHRYICPVSSYVLPQTTDRIILGLKQEQEEYWLDCPGSGFLDSEADTHEPGSLKSPATLLRRELAEELAVSEEIGRVRCFGIYGEASGGFLINPAFFSTAYLTRPSSAVVAGAREAVDGWEFERFITLPHPTATELRSLIDGETTLIDRDVKPALPVSHPIQLAPKCPLMLALYGRGRFGADWFQSLRTESILECIPAENAG